MIYLRTGANGSCKTLFTLADVRKLQVETGRPVCINSRFKMNEAKRIEFGWAVVDFKDWQAEPDGTIFLIDECHNDMPVRSASSPVPQPIKMLAEHRSRGFDFFLLTQHPMNIDSFVRKLIGAPGYHQHLKRVFGGTNTTRVLQWDAVNPICEKDGSGNTAQITTRVHPKEVYKWYDSASLHTAKIRIPKAVFALVGSVVLLLLVLYYGYGYLKKSTTAATASPSTASASYVAPGSQASGARPPAATADGRPAPLTSADLLASYAPRFEGMPQTAPRYDEVTKPTIAPYPAACVSMGSVCRCYTQQGTLLQTPLDLCKQIVSQGFFQDWGQQGQQPHQERVQPAQTVPATPWSGNPGSSPAVAIPEPLRVAAAEASSAGDAAALSSMRIGRRLVSSN